MRSTLGWTSLRQPWSGMSRVPREEELAEIRARLDVVAARPIVDRALQERVDGVVTRLEGIETVEGTIAELRSSIEVLDALRVDDSAAIGTRLAGLEFVVEGLAGVEERIRQSVDRNAADAAQIFASRLDGVERQLGAVDALEDRLAALAEAVEAGAAGHEELASRIDDAIGAMRADVNSRASAFDKQLQAQSSEAAALREQIQGLQEASSGQAELERLEGLETRLGGEVATMRKETASVRARIDELHSLREADTRAAKKARSASERLAERVETIAVAAEAAPAIEKALRKELRVELERVGSSMGWRLERIEESLASGDVAELEAAVAELGRRLEQQTAIGEEQVRVTERALRKGLAKLGKRLADTESEYVDAGNSMRRSIERLGAAVVEADARMAHQVPVSEAEGCVAFAPTAVGYRLIELPGKPPEVGSTIELDSIEGALVVTGYGRSPLPLDSRACAYLDRA